MRNTKYYLMIPSVHQSILASLCSPVTVNRRGTIQKWYLFVKLFYMFTNIDATRSPILNVKDAMKGKFLL